MSKIFPDDQSAVTPTLSDLLMIADVTDDDNIIKATLEAVRTAMAFTWSTSEQEWPWEKNSSGETLYAKQINLGPLPNSGTLSDAHGVSGLTTARVFSLRIKADDGSDCWQLPWADGSTVTVGWIDGTNISIYASNDRSSFTGTAFLIYSKG